MFEVRAFTEDDYLEFGEWHELRGRPVMKYDYLSPEGCRGLVVHDEKESLVMGFLYSFGKMGVIGGLASKPKAEHRGEAMDVLLKTLVGMAKESGHEVAIINTNRPTLIARFEHLGFSACDRDMVQLVRVL